MTAPLKRKAEVAFPSEPLHNDQSHSSNHEITTSQRAHSNKSSKLTLHQKAQSHLLARQKLPIWPHADEIRQKVRDHDVLLLVGETGSGKSTQIPQFLYQEKWCQARKVSLNSSSPVNKPPSGNDKHGTDGSNGKGNVKKVGGRIAILQPRRVAAISLASRVASEIGTPLGTSSPQSTVGYSVRFDNNCSANTRIKFLTDGMLLNELLRDPSLLEYSAVIVDEVHERGVNGDLVLGFLRRILEARGKGRGGVELKVVVMSATANMGELERFFREGGDSVGAVGNSEAKGDGSKDGQVQGNMFEGFSDADEDENAQRLASNGHRSGEPQVPARSKTVSLSTCYIAGRQYPVTTTYLPSFTDNLLDAAMSRISEIHAHEPLPGDVLVFLSGQEMIENLESLCHTYARSLDPSPTDPSRPQTGKPRLSHQPRLPALQILPLFAALPPHRQTAIFSPTPPHTRRVILSTNISETSLTVPNIRHVIDTGKHKSRHFRPGLNLDTLLSQPISKSSAAQRAGRAGRESPGQCYRLYTRADFDALEDETKPEILNADLGSLVLMLKAHGVDDVLGFPLLTKPPRRALEAALENLLNLGAIDEDTGMITEVGRKMAGLPVRPDLARVLLASTEEEMGCTQEIVDVVSGLAGDEGIFLPLRARRDDMGNGQVNGRKSTEQILLEKKNGIGEKVNGSTHDDDNVNVNGGDINNSGSDTDQETDTNPIALARRTLYSRHSDHLTLLNAIKAYCSPSVSDRRAWCDAHGISHRAMSRIMDVRKQLGRMMSSSRYRLNSTAPAPSRNGAQDIDPKQLHTSTPEIRSMDLNTRILKSLLTGLWPNVAILSSLHDNNLDTHGKHKINPNQRAPYTTLLTKQGIWIHPSSVAFVGATGGVGGPKNKKKGKRDKGRGQTNMPRAIVFTDLVYTSRPFARGVSAVDVSWVAEVGRLA